MSLCSVVVNKPFIVLFKVSVRALVTVGRWNTMPPVRLAPVNAATLSRWSALMRVQLEKLKVIPAAEVGDTISCGVFSRE